MFFACSRLSGDKEEHEKRTESAATPAPIAPPMPQPPSVQDQVMQSKTLQEALFFLVPHMENTSGSDLPAAAAVLAMWMNKKFWWNELMWMPDSKRVEAMKDPISFRGKRICLSGSVVEIYADHSVDPVAFNGTIMTASFDTVRFIAVRSTRGIHENSPAKLCGIITGTQTYPTTGGGFSHALFVVGVFDLPENRSGGNRF